MKPFYPSFFRHTRALTLGLMLLCLGSNKGWGQTIGAPSVDGSLICKTSLYYGQITFSTTGTFAGDNTFNANLYDINTGNYVATIGVGNSTNLPVIGTITNVQSGTYRMRVQSSNPFVLSPQSSIITVADASALSISNISMSAPSSITLGESVNLSISIAGGSSPYYAKFTDDVSVKGTNLPLQRLVSPSATTTYTLSTMWSRCQYLISSSIRTVTINVVPPCTTPTPSISGTTTYCTGQTIALTASGGTTYSWAGPNTFSSTSATISREATTTNGGAYTVTAANGTCTVSTSVSVLVNDNPTVSVTSNSPVCVGNSINLSASGSGTTFTWSGPNAFSATGATPTIAEATTTMSGAYTVTAANGSCTATANTSVSVSVCSTCTIPQSIVGETQYCFGGTISLSAVAGCSTPTAYLWSGPNGFSSQASTINIENARINRTGLYQVQISYPTETITLSVSITVLPNSIKISSNTPVCIGGDLMLSLPPLSDGSTVLWNGPQNFTSDSQSPVIESAVAANEGQYSVTVTQNGCTMSSTVQIEVNPTLSLAATSNAPICVGEMLRLSAVSPANAGFSWKGPRGFSTIAKNPTYANVNTNNSGVYSVTLTAVGSCSVSATTLVAVNVFPVVNITTSTDKSILCSGSSLVLSSSAANAAVYQWFKDNKLINGATTSNLTITSAGTYRADITNTGGCLAKRTISITSASTPSVVASNTVSATKIVLNANPTGLKYSWSGPAGFSSTMRNPNILSPTSANAGIYTVLGLVASSGCSATATTSVVVGSPVSRLASGEDAENQGIRLTLYPNPTQGKLVVEVQLNEAASVELDLFDMMGQCKHHRSNSEETTLHRVELDITTFAEGMYLLRAVSSNRKQATVKVVKVN